MTALSSYFRDGINANEAVTLVSQAHKRLSDTLHRPLKDQERTDVKQVSGALKELLEKDGLPADEAKAAADRIVNSWHEAMIGAKDFSDYSVRFRAHADGPGGTLAFSPQSLHFPDAKPAASAVPAPAPPSPPPAPVTPPVAAVEQPEAPPLAIADVVSSAKAAFARIDADGDGELSKSELKAALVSSSFKGKDAAAVAVMINRYGDIAAGHDDRTWVTKDSTQTALGWAASFIGGPVAGALAGPTAAAVGGRNGITLADVDAMADSGAAGHYLERFGTYLSRMDQTSAKAFPNGLADIKPGYVTQNELADCYFVSALSSLARQRPADVQQMIKDNEDGTFTVTFPGKDPVTIDSPTDGEVALYGNSDGHGRWVTILEKAYAKQTHDKTWVPVGDHPQDSIGYGDMTWAGIEILSSKGSSTYVPGGSLSAVIQGNVLSAQNEKRMMTANITPLTFAKTVTTKAGYDLNTKHVYEVVGFTDSSMATIKIRNPWGTGGPNGDGYHEMAFDEFLSIFQTVSIED